MIKKLIKSVVIVLLMVFAASPMLQVNEVSAASRSVAVHRSIPEGTTFVLNKNTKKFHMPNCSSVDDIKEKNISFSAETASEIKSKGYSPCKKCKPADGKIGTVKEQVVSTDADYVLNKNTKKFHYPSCSSVGDIKPKNRLDVSLSREEIINQGYSPCKRCNP